MKAIRAWAAAVSLLAFAGTAPAALLDRGGGMIYDTTLNITWLKDWNYAATSGYDDDGRMTWDAAWLWADNLVFGGFSDWRLPTSLPPDCVFVEGGGNCGKDL